ncbi:hypothetical protein LNQ03_27415 [Klebsiella pneumoniae subsp. pneumoniae]|nr:hypothetical protein [Klebsiella pneumoniae subsp. pneumoniae]
MKQKVVSIGDINVANDLPFVLFGGMNVLESRDLAMRICEHYVYRYAEAWYSLRLQSLL